MTSKRATLRRKRFERREVARKIAEYVEWCKQNVLMREEGVERPLTTAEAAEFILMTMK